MYSLVLLMLSRYGLNALILQSLFMKILPLRHTFSYSGKGIISLYRLLTLDVGMVFLSIYLIVKVTMELVLISEVGKYGTYIHRQPNSR